MSDKIGNVTPQCKIAAGLFWADYAVLGGQVQGTGAGRRRLAAHRGARRQVYGLRHATWRFRHHRGRAQEHRSGDRGPVADGAPQLRCLPPTGRPGRQPDHAAAGDHGRVDHAGRLVHRRCAGHQGRASGPGRARPSRPSSSISSPTSASSSTRAAPTSGPRRPARAPTPWIPSWSTTSGGCVRWSTDAGLESQIDIMEDGGLNAGNVDEFIAAGMTVGEFSSPLLKGPNGKLQPGTGEIEAAVKKLRAAMDEQLSIDDCQRSIVNVCGHVGRSGTPTSPAKRKRMVNAELIIVNSVVTAASVQSA